MTDIELSEFIRNSYKINDISKSGRKAVCGIATNDSDYLTQPVVASTRLRCPAYQSWASMIKRCYAKPSGRSNPNYLGVSVCQEWLSFMAFRSWWLINHRDGASLDKDLIGGGVLYSPENCVYVPQRLNNFLLDCRNARGKYKIGASYHAATAMFAANCRNAETGKYDYLGLFNDPESAHQAWKRHKLAQADKLRGEMDAIDDRIYKNVINTIKAAT